jgi:hypothetical protein
MEGLACSSAEKRGISIDIAQRIGDVRQRRLKPASIVRASRSS